MPLLSDGELYMKINMCTCCRIRLLSCCKFCVFTFKIYIKTLLYNILYSISETVEFIFVFVGDTLLCDVNYSCKNLTWLTDLINVFFRLKWQVGIIDFIELKVESYVLFFVVKVSERGIKTTLSLMYIQWLNSLLLWSIQKIQLGCFLHSV